MVGGDDEGGEGAVRTLSDTGDEPLTPDGHGREVGIRDPGRRREQ
jgi:hypothetical protein